MRIFSARWRKVWILAILAGAVYAPLRAAQVGQPEQPPAQQPESDPHLAEKQAAQRQALGFLQYLDQGRFADSYAYTGMLIRTQLDKQAFAKQLEKARADTGPFEARELMDASYDTSLPGAPDGQYVVLHYRASFAHKQEAVETVVLQFAKGYWRVVGYYIK